MKNKDMAGLAVIGLGAVAVYAATRKNDVDDLGVFPDAWSGGSATPETPPQPTITPAITFPEMPQYVEQAPPEWLFYPPMPDYGSTTEENGQKKISTPAPVGNTTSAATDAPQGNIGPTAGFGGGGAGGRSDEPTGGIGDVLKRLLSPLNLFMSATPLGVLAPAANVGISLATNFVGAPTKKEALATGVAPVAEPRIGGSPADAISSFYNAGADYGAPVDTTKKGSAVTTVYESGAYQTVSHGQIVSAGSAGSTAPAASAPSTGRAHAASTGQVYSSPGSSLGGRSGSVMSKKSASTLSGNSAAAKAWRSRYGGG